MATAASWTQHLDHLAGRHVVVTGVGGGIGMATAEAFAESGSRVIGVDRTTDAANLALSGLPGTGHVGVGIDFDDPTSVTSGLADVRSASRDIAVLVNVGGIAEDSTVHMTSQASIRRHLQVNFESQVQITQYVTRLMSRTGGGSVVNVSSVTATDGNPGQLAYGASKAALANSTRIMSMELAALGIRVNAVAPGVIDTAMNRSLDPPTRNRLLDRVSMGRLGTPSEVASVILWLSTAAAAYVTGQVVRVDGGM